MGFDTFEAYEIKYIQRVWGNGVDITDDFTWWISPYIGVIKDDSATHQL